MFSAIRSLSLNLSRRYGLQRLFRLRSKGPVVLFYHGVVEHMIDPEVQGLHLPLAVFERQIEFLRREREIISLDELSAYFLKQKGLHPRQVALTFDDGYKNNLDIVAPLLKAWNLPFAIFVSTRPISGARRFPMYQIRAAILYTSRSQVYLHSVQRGFDLTSREKRLAAVKTLVEMAKIACQDRVESLVSECQSLLASEHWSELNTRFASDEPMSWHDVVQIRSMGATIGSHTHDHCILHSNQKQAEVYRQLIESKRAIEDLVGECKYLAYPNGAASDVSPAARTAAERAGFTLAFTTMLGEVTSQSDAFLLPRVFAVPDFEEFCYLMNRSSRQNGIRPSALSVSTAARSGAR
jgi:peptidoglycan/xylan/chitin deacetylase (PgdA/CDA1 family)